MAKKDPARPAVIVVDDEEGIRGLLVDILYDLGYDAIAASDGEAAVEELKRAAGLPVKLAIVDLVLPGMSGIETLRALRAIVPRLPGIVSTGYDDQIQPSGLSLGETARLEDFETLAKPYKIDDLSLKIERAMASFDSARGRPPR